MSKIILVISCVLAVIADMTLVWWAKHPKHPSIYLIIGMLTGLIGLGSWAYSMHLGVKSAMAITVYSLLTMVGCSFLGMVIFKEALTAINMVGIGLAIVALVLVSV